MDLQNCAREHRAHQWNGVSPHAAAHPWAPLKAQVCQPAVSRGYAPHRYIHL
jgi:hypothetical protein